MYLEFTLFWRNVGFAPDVRIFLGNVYQPEKVCVNFLINLETFVAYFLILLETIIKENPEKLFPEKVRMPNKSPACYHL